MVKIGTIILVVVGVILLGVILTMGYLKAGPDEALIISGFRTKILSGNSGIRIPFLERVDRLSLSAFSVDVRTPDFVATNDYINLAVDGIVKVQIGSTDELMKLAAKNYVNKNIEYMVESVQDVLEGNLREIIGQMKLTDVVKDRQKFGEAVSANAKPDLEKLGLEIISFNVQTLRDEKNLIKALGVENEVKIQKASAITKAESQKEIAMAQSIADEEANRARVLSSKHIAEQNNELAIRQAELERESNVKKAEAEASYLIEQERQRKQQEIVKAEANREKSEREIEINRNRLVSERNNEEDAKLYAMKQEAEGIKLVAQAKSDAVKLEAEAEAERVRKIGEAEAENIRKKADAMQAYGEAAKLEIILEAYTEMSKNIAEPLNSIDKITMYGEGNQTKLVEDITRSLNQVNDGVGESLGLDLKSIIMGMMGGKLAQSNDVTPVTQVETDE